MTTRAHVVPRMSFLHAASSDTPTAEDLYDSLREGRESVTVSTALGARYRAFRDGRGVTVLAGRRVVYLHSSRAAAAYVCHLRASVTIGTPDERETLASLVESVVGL